MLFFHLLFFFLLFAFSFILFFALIRLDLAPPRVSIQKLLFFALCALDALHRWTEDVAVKGNPVVVDWRHAPSSHVKSVLGTWRKRCIYAWNLQRGVGRRRSISLLGEEPRWRCIGTMGRRRRHTQRTPQGMREHPRSKSLTTGNLGTALELLPLVIDISKTSQLWLRLVLEECIV